MWSTDLWSPSTGAGRRYDPRSRWVVVKAARLDSCRLAPESVYAAQSRTGTSAKRGGKQGRLAQGFAQVDRGR